ncbi:hypothetical protein [Variovorax sp. PBL-H6]|uniref:hypothetical protein n=2 Tax=Variovorax TaxID=34072 RepID=UPI0013A5469F|nr:hypothetical protein [Variovorax sp. PBL-H6]
MSWQAPGVQGRSHDFADPENHMLKRLPQALATAASLLMATHSAAAGGVMPMRDLTVLGSAAFPGSMLPPGARPAQPQTSNPSPAPGSPTEAAPAPDAAGPWSDTPTLTVARALQAELHRTDSLVATFQNTTGKTLQLNYLPVGVLAYPFSSQVESGCPAVGGTLAVGATCKLLLQFAPGAGAAGTYQDAESFFFQWQFEACAAGACGDPAAAGHKTLAMLTGQVTAPARPVMLAFDQGGALGYLPAGTVLTRKVKLHNSGTNNYQVYSVGFFQDGSQGQIKNLSSTCQIGVAGGQTCELSFTVEVSQWQPAGTYRSTLRVGGADPAANNYSLNADIEVSFTK